MQAVEAKEKVPILGDSTTQASITYQCFFKYYPKLAGMTVRLTSSSEAHNLCRILFSCSGFPHQS